MIRTSRVINQFSLQLGRFFRLDPIQTTVALTHDQYNIHEKVTIITFCVHMIKFHDGNTSENHENKV